MLHKSILISLVCATALMLSSCGGGGGKSETLSSCSGGDESKIQDFIWFKAEIPQGFVADTLPGRPNYTDVFFWKEENGMKRKIIINWLSLSALNAKTIDDYLQSFVKLDSRSYTIGSDVTIGKNKWKTLMFSPASGIFMSYYYTETNIADRVFQLTGDQMKLDDPDWQLFLKDFTLPDDIRAARDRAYETKFGELKKSN